MIWLKISRRCWLKESGEPRATTFLYETKKKGNQNMKKSIIRLSLLVLVAAAMAAIPGESLAQSTNKAAVEKTTGPQTTEPNNSEKPGKAGPFHGKLAAIDKVAKTITVGKRTFQITSETKIKKSGKPAVLEDGVVGETVSGYVKPSADGKLAATTVTFGPKVSSGSGEKPSTASSTEKQAK
jgi:hypothetical protein